MTCNIPTDIINLIAEFSSMTIDIEYYKRNTKTAKKGEIKKVKATEYCCLCKNRKVSKKKGKTLLTCNNTLCPIRLEIYEKHNIKQTEEEIYHKFSEGWNKLTLNERKFIISANCDVFDIKKGETWTEWNKRNNNSFLLDPYVQDHIECKLFNKKQKELSSP